MPVVIFELQRSAGLPRFNSMPTRAAEADNTLVDFAPFLNIAYSLCRLDASGKVSGFVIASRSVDKVMAMHFIFLYRLTSID